MIKRIASILVSVIMFTANVFASNEDKWTRTFVVTSGEETALGLTEGTLVRITNERPTCTCGTYFVEVLPFGPDFYLSESAGGMAGLTYKTFKYKGRRIDVEKNAQINPGWMKIGSCELRVKKE